MKRIKLPPYNKLGPEPLWKPPKAKFYKPKKQTKLFDKNLIADDIELRNRYRQMFR